MLAVEFVKIFAKLTALIEGEGRAERETANRQAERLQRVASFGAYRLPISRFSKDLGSVREDRSERGGEVFCGVLPCSRAIQGKPPQNPPPPVNIAFLAFLVPCVGRAFGGSVVLPLHFVPHSTPAAVAGVFGAVAVAPTPPRNRLKPSPGKFRA